MWCIRKQRIGNRSIRKLLCLFVFICLPCRAYGEWTEWLADMETSYSFHDNINNAMFNSAEEHDQVWNTSISVGRAYQLTDNTRLFANLYVDGNVHETYDRLNQLDTGVSFSLRHKFGLGAYQPWVRGSVSSGYIFSRSKIREGQTLTAGLDVGKALHERLDIMLSYRFDYRDSRNHKTVAATKLIAARIEPGKSNSVFDIKGHDVGIQFNTLLTQQWLLVFAYHFRYGDVVSSNSPALVPRIHRIVDAIAIDDALPGWSYRSEGITHRYAVDANYAFMKGRAAFNVGYEFIESHVDSFTYQNNQFRLNLNYSF